MNVLDCPIDVLYHILAYLDLDDLLTLRKTCNTLRTVTTDRTVWHDALMTRSSLGLPIPGLQQRELCDLTVDDLERLTIRSCRFWSNWTSSAPKWHKQAVIRQPGRWTTDPSARNLAAEFLPGGGGRYLLTLTLHSDASHATESRRFAFECWDITEPSPKLVANLLVAGLLGYAINTVPNSSHVLAVNRRDAHNQLCITTYGLDFSNPDTDPWFRETSRFNSFRHTLGLDGSHFVATDADQEVRIFDADSGRLLYTLKVPLTHADPTLRLQEYDCLDFELFDGYILTFCKQWIFLYQLRSTPDTVAEAPRLAPVAQYRWPWRIDTISISPRQRGSRTPGLPTIDMLIRFDTWYPWPVNVLHHFVLCPNAAFRPPSPDPPAPEPETARTLPYLSSAGGPDTPALMHSIPSPVRLFTPSDMVLGQRGTALWLDAATDPLVPSQTGDRGQRIAFKNVAEGGDWQRNGGWDQGELQGDALAREGAGDVTVLHVQVTEETWSKVAVNESEGLVAVGHVDGRVSVYSYVPP